MLRPRKLSHTSWPNMTQEVKNEIRMTLSFDLNLQKPGNFDPVSTILPSSLISISAPEFRGFDGQWSWGSALFLFSVGWPALLHSYLSGPYTHTHTHTFRCLSLLLLLVTWWHLRLELVASAYLWRVIPCSCFCCFYRCSCGCVKVKMQQSSNLPVLELLFDGYLMG